MPYDDYKYIDHVNVIVSQMRNGDFAKTDDDYKMRTAAAYEAYLYNAALKSEITFDKFHQMENDFSKEFGICINIGSRIINVIYGDKEKNYDAAQVQNPH
jgi:hypothetical protein